MSKRIYFDEAATAKLHPAVAKRMHQVIDQLMTGSLGNPSALHSPGQASKAIIEDARAQVAQLIGAEPAEIVFTSGATESNNTVVRTFAGQPIITSVIEHPSVLMPAAELASEFVKVSVNHWGEVSLDDWEQAVQRYSQQKFLSSVMFANNELGTIQDIKSLARLTHKAGGMMHSDLTQAVGKVKINVKELDLDFASFSAHKLGGPVGIGALYVKQGRSLRPLLRGGEQESSRRAGTGNVLLAAGFGAAVKWCWDNWSCKKWAEVAKLRDELRRRILKEVPYSSCNSPEKNCLPNILNVSFQAAEGESIQLMLDAAGIAVSTGSACASGSLEPSYVLMATAGDAEVAHSSIRFSLGLDTTSEDIDYLLRFLPDIITKLQGISTVKIKEQNV